MSPPIQDSIVLVARILATTAIVRYGVAKFFDPALFIENPATIGFMRAFCGGAAAPAWLAYANAVFQTGAGLCVMAGFKARWAAAALVVWLAMLTFFGHPFWAQSGLERTTNESLFLRNLAMAAALMMVVAFGTGRFSLDAIAADRAGPEPGRVP